LNRRLLVVSPNFPPVNGADVHRVRTTLPFFAEFGWDAEVLAVESACIASPMDPWLLDGIPKSIPVHRCKALSLRWSGIPGLGTLDLRAGRAMRRLGTKILQERTFDLVYFSTTTFSLMTLGPIWNERFKIPYVVDYQDPWITDYYREHPDVRPPGGRFKYAIVQAFARRQEPRVIRDCSGITAVSPAYCLQLKNRYRSAANIPSLMIPFPGARRDFERLSKGGLKQSIFDPHDGCLHWMYVGVSGPIMYKALGALFRAVSNWRETNGAEVSKLRMHFVGTSYAPAGTAAPVVLPLATRYGLEDLVDEKTDRVSYCEALLCMRDAHALLAPGSDDATYNASKLLPYLMAQKPLLAIFHADSPAADLLRQTGGASLVQFQSSENESTIALEIQKVWILNSQFQKCAPADSEKMENYMDRGQAKKLCEFFNNILAPSNCPS